MTYPTKNQINVDQTKIIYNNTYKLDPGNPDQVLGSTHSSSSSSSSSGHTHTHNPNPGGIYIDRDFLVKMRPSKHQHENTHGIKSTTAKTWELQKYNFALQGNTHAHQLKQPNGTFTYRTKFRNITQPKAQGLRGWSPKRGSMGLQMGGRDMSMSQGRGGNGLHTLL